MGLLRQIEGAIALAFALPPAMLGVESLRAGDELGFLWLGLAVAFFVATMAIPQPQDVPRRIVERLFDRVAASPEERDREN